MPSGGEDSFDAARCEVVELRGQCWDHAIRTEAVEPIATSASGVEASFAEVAERPGPCRAAPGVVRLERRVADERTHALVGDAASLIDHS